MLTLRCPRCCRGQVFDGLLKMRTHCPVCGTKFERETGYFLNAMFIAYAIGFLILIPTAVVLFLAKVTPVVFALAVSGVALLITPLIFRYSRVLWMHADEVMDPRPEERED